MPYRTKVVTDDSPRTFSLNGLACVAVGLIAVAVCNLTGSDSIESLVAFIAAAYGADLAMPYRTK
jgi:hypothetical protein